MTFSTRISAPPGDVELNIEATIRGRYSIGVNWRVLGPEIEVADVDHAGRYVTGKPLARRRQHRGRPFYADKAVRRSEARDERSHRLAARAAEVDDGRVRL